MEEDNIVVGFVFIIKLIGLWLGMNDGVILIVLMIDRDIFVINFVCYCDRYWFIGSWKWLSCGWIYWLYKYLVEVGVV